MRDVFGVSTHNVTSSVLNVASSNRYNPERLVLKVDGSVVQPEYGSVAQYNHTGKRHQLQPNAGETVSLQTAERPKYVVQYESAASLAFAANKKAPDLSGDDRIRVGRFDGSDGWALEFNSGHDENRVDLITLRGGSVVKRKVDENLRSPLSSFVRVLGRGAWYDATRHQWTVSVVVSDQQVNSEIGQQGMQGDGPHTPNLPIRWEVRADSGTSDLVLDAGSCGYVQYGNTSRFVRTKEIIRKATLSVVGEWEPLFAFRKKNQFSDIRAQIRKTQILAYGTADLLEVGVQSFVKSKVGFSGNDSWDTPEVWAPSNNNMELREDPNSIPDVDGNTSSSVTNPGGYQLNFHAITGDRNNSAGSGVVGAEQEKALLHEDRFVVIIGKVESGGAADTATIYTKWTQGW